MLFLIFTALSYGDIDPKYKALEHPWDRCLSPRVDENLNLDLVIVVINPGFYFIYTLQSDQIHQNSQELTNEKVDPAKNHNHLRENDKKFQQ
jgi:hypothetical protein